MEVDASAKVNKDDSLTKIYTSVTMPESGLMV